MNEKYTGDYASCLGRPEASLCGCCKRFIDPEDCGKHTELVVPSFTNAYQCKHFEPTLHKYGRAA